MRLPYSKITTRYLTSFPTAFDFTILLMLNVDGCSKRMYQIHFLPAVYFYYHYHRLLRSLVNDNSAYAMYTHRVRIRINWLRCIHDFLIHYYSYYSLKFYNNQLRGLGYLQKNSSISFFCK